MSVVFHNRMGKIRQLEYYHGENIESVLVRNRIPIMSVLCTCCDVPVSEKTVIQDNQDYQINLIEGYDIDTILAEVFSRENDNKYVDAYVKNRLLFNVDGSLITEHVGLDVEAVAEMVEENIEFAITNYNLISDGETVLVGLSGGVDSSSLLIALSNISKRLGFKVVAATFRDFDSLSSPTFENARNLAKSLGIEHHLIDSDLIEQVFNLNKPLKEVLPEMMETEYSCYAMYADHHTTRRALEVFAKEIGVSKIVLGLHTTDILAGLLNSYSTGYQVADIFNRRIGEYTYIYPLMYVPKKELHLYFYFHQRKFAVHSYPNSWELNPKDRNFYYYLADQLQEFFPGIENYFFEANSWQLKRQKALDFTKCSNCGSSIMQQESAPQNNNLCDVCSAFSKLGYLNEGINEN